MAKNRDPLGVQRRWSLLERDNFTCAYCGSRPGNEHLHVDHIIPYSQGGSDHDNNLVTACDRCNQGKAARVAVPARMLDGFVSSDGWRTWKRWGGWHLMFDPSVAVLSYDPNGIDYWIPLDRIHEPDWHRHIRHKEFVREPEELAEIEAFHAKRAEQRGRLFMTLDEFFDEDNEHPLERRNPSGQRWLDFCDAIDFCRTLVRKGAHC